MEVVRSISKSRIMEVRIENCDVERLKEKKKK